MVAGANELGQWLTLNGQTRRWQPHLRGLRLDRRRPDLGRRDGRGVRPSSPYEDFQTPPGDEIAGVLSTRARRRPAMSVEAATAALQAAGFTVADGGQVNSETGAGPGRLHLTRGRRAS